MTLTERLNLNQGRAHSILAALASISIIVGPGSLCAEELANAAVADSQIIQDSTIPTYLQPLVTKIKAGESGGRNVLYGGAPVPPGNVIPGAIGPTGRPTHAFGEWQFQPDTWNAAAEAFRQVGKILNKDEPTDRDRAGLWVARRDYKTNTGRDLDGDAQAGHVNEAALRATWTSLHLSRRLSAPAEKTAHQKLDADPNIQPRVTAAEVDVKQTDPFSAGSQEVTSSFLITNSEEK